LKNTSGEIEIDIDALDSRTLRELERYVKGQLKKNVNTEISNVKDKLQKLTDKSKHSSASASKKAESSSSSDSSDSDDSGSDSDGSSSS